ncbi:MAG: hypothetical protein MJZ22_03835 [Candidatus Saccharibacteria bacterium]|nr:hypothetical protein [Candidatus Saccharibacteria bacterium]
MNKNEMVINYFKSFGCGFIVCILIGVAIIYFGSDSGAAIATGILFCIIGIAWCVFSAKKIVSDKQFDEIKNEYLENLKSVARQKVDIDESELIADCNVLVGPRLWNVGGATVLHKQGDDKVLRYTPLNVTILNYTANQLLSYTCVFDLTTGKALNETTDEFFYKDIVSVSTKTESKTYVTDDKKETLQLNAAEMFYLKTAGGNGIEIVLSDPTLAKEMGGGEFDKSGIDNMLQSIRRMLREKKSG